MSMNVFADLGFPNPEEHIAKAKLVSELSNIIKEKGLTQTEVAELWNLSQPKVSDLLRGQFRGYSIDRLLKFVNLLNRNVTIVVEKYDAPDVAYTEVLAA